MVHVHTELENMISKAHLNPLKKLKNEPEDNGYKGQNGTYNFDFTFGDFFIKGLGAKRGLL